MAVVGVFFIGAGRETRGENFVKVTPSAGTISYSGGFREHAGLAVLAWQKNELILRLQ